jgi:ribonuclease D
MQRIIVRNGIEARLAYGILRESLVIGCDTETSSLNPKTGRLHSIQFSTGEVDVLVPISEGVRPDALIDLLADDSIIKVFHNAKFDLSFLSASSYRTENVFCTMNAEKVLTRGANQSVSLAETIYRHFGIDLDKGKRDTFSSGWDGLWTEELIEYALSDVRFLPGLREEQMAWMNRLGLLSRYEEMMSTMPYSVPTNDGTQDDLP